MPHQSIDSEHLFHLVQKDIFITLASLAISIGPMTYGVLPVVFTPFVHQSMSDQKQVSDYEYYPQYKVSSLLHFLANSRKWCNV